MQACGKPWAADDGFERCETMEVPLLGVVAAGEPYQAFPLDETLSVPTALWAGKQVFALRVRGTSMVDEGIYDGDYLIVEPRQQADNGQTVVAEVDGGVTVKKYYRDAAGAVRLQPANAALLPLRVRADQVRIIGVVAGVFRKCGGFAPPRPARPERAPRPAAHVEPASRPAARPHPVTPPAAEQASLDLALNVIDSQLIRWNAAVEHARHDRRLRQHLPRMQELGRDLQALRDWCARTRKPSLRRALIAEANKVMSRMQRFASVTPVRLPDLVVH